MNLFYPRFPWRLLPRMLWITVLGAMVGGVYGVLHDQITYSISHEYFTKLKFDQFKYANFGFPVRIFVSEVGFLATWWVGFFAAWFLARIAVTGCYGRIVFVRETAPRNLRSAIGFNRFARLIFQKKHGKA